MYTRYTCVYTICTPYIHLNTSLNTQHNTILALKQPIKQVLGTVALLRALDLLRLLHPPLLHVHAIRYTLAIGAVVEPKPI